MSRLYTAVLLGVMVSMPGTALAAPAGPGAAAPPPVAQSATEEARGLLAQGDDSARAGRYVDALDAWRRGFEKLFPGFRGLPFRKPVEVEYLDRAGLRGRLLEILAKEEPDEQIRAEQKAMAAFGFVAPDLDLKETMVQLLSEAVAGFYDPERKRLCLIKEGESARPLGKESEAGQYKVALLHEMAHALMDQHHNTLAMERAAQKDDDQSLAVRGLVEGEATLAVLVGMDARGQALLRQSPLLFDLGIALLKPFLSLASGPSFRNAPPILRETMLFPYMKGITFCLKLTGKTGTWQPVDAAFARPPVSTEQLLHPEKYPADQPIALSVADVRADLPEGWAPVYANTMGELQTQVLLAGALPGVESIRAAEGWAGDSYRVYERTGGPSDLPRSLYVWLSTWDTQDDAREFREAMVRSLAARMQQDALDITEFPVLPKGMWGKAWLSNESLSAVLGRGSDVWVLYRVPETAMDAVLAKVLQVKHAAKGVWRPPVRRPPARPGSGPAKPTPKPATGKPRQ